MEHLEDASHTWERVEHLLDATLELLYGELERLARRQLAGHRRGTLLDTSDLVHDAFLKLSAGASLPSGGRTHILPGPCVKSPSTTPGRGLQRSAPAV